MTLSSLLSLPYPTIASALQAAYPDLSENNMLGFQEVWEHLKTLKPVASTTRIVIKWVDPDPRWNDPEDEGYWDVSGKDEARDKAEGQDGSSVGWALEFTPWAEWLGMEIEEESLIGFTPEEIIAHCLWEMTFCGFTEAEINDEWKVIEERASEAESILLGMED